MIPLLLTLSTACQEPQLILELPEEPLAGEIEVTIKGNVDELAILVDGEPLADEEDNTAAPGPVWTVAWDTTDWDDGVRSLTGQGYMDGGGDPVEVTLDVTVDQIAGDEERPEVLFVTPLDGDIRASTLDISIQVDDNAGLASLELEIDGALIESFPPPTGSRSYTAETTWSGGAEGPHELRAVATDLAGFTDVAIANVEISDSGDCLITSPVDGEEVGGSVEIRAAAVDAASFEFFAGGESVGTDQNGDDGWSATWDTRGLVGQEVEIWAIATQVDKNTCDTRDDGAVTVTVIKDDDPTGLIVRITQPSDGNPITAESDAFPITAQISGGEGPEYAFLTVDGAQYGDTLYADDTSDWRWNFDATVYNPGDEIILVVTAYERETGEPASDTYEATISK